MTDVSPDANLFRTNAEDFTKKYETLTGNLCKSAKKIYKKSQEIATLYLQ
jgi:hypothetical protein